MACILHSLTLGAYHISPTHVYQILIANFTGILPPNVTAMEVSMIYDVRLPRILGAVVAGCGLAVADGVFQALFGNPLASPYTLGVSNGAGFGAALAIVLSLPAAGVQMAALVFGIVSVGLTFLLAGRKRGASVTMILSGMLVSAFFSSLVALLKFTADPQEKLPQIVYWLMGSLASVKFDGLLLILPAYLAALTLLFLYRWRINILSMGEQEAQSMGVAVRRDRAVIILAATLVTALVVSISGIIGWVGIAHLAEQPYTNISGGERQLVLLAAALTQQPELLILDEPTAHLDFGNAHRFLDLVLRLHAQGIGILMTTHFPDHALYLSAETLVLKDKTLWKHGAAAEVIDEEGMSALYGLPVHIGQIGTRTVCVGGEIA